MDALPPSLESRFEPHRVLGKGSMGLVVHCTDREKGLSVALKLLDARDGTEAARFEQEARITKAFRHPNIARLHDWGRLPDGYWLAMEYLQGETLRTYLEREGPIVSGRRVLLLTRQCVKALTYAHKKGVLHRDVKPENLFLLENDVLKLIDFGLAKYERDGKSPVRTRPGMLLGTPAYMAPERCRGEPAVEASDVYSLATVVYEMMAGEPPFRGPPMEVMRAQLRDPPAPLPSHIPADISDTVLAALAKDPKARPGSALAFMEELRAAARRVIDKKRRGETPKETERVSDFQADDLASHGELDQVTPKPPPKLPTAPATAGPAEIDDDEEPAATTQLPSADLPPTQATTRESLGPRPMDSDAIASDRPTRSVDAGPLQRSVRRLSRALVPPSLLSPRVRPYVFGGVGVALLLVLWSLLPGAGPIPLPESVDVTPGLEGVEIRWRSSRPGRWGFLVLPAGEAPPGRWTPPQRVGVPSEEGKEEISGLSPDLPYVLWAASDDGVPQRVQDFRTFASFRIRQLDFLSASSGLARLRVEAAPPWDGTFGKDDPDGELRESRVLLLPPSASRLPEFRVRTAGLSRPRPVKGLSRAMLEHFLELLDRADPRAAAREIFDAFPPDVLEKGELGSLEVVGKVKEVLEGNEDLGAVLRVRSWFPPVLDADDLTQEQRLSLARKIAELAEIDAALEALQARAALGRNRDELAGALRLLYSESSGGTPPDPEDPRPAKAVFHWWNTSENDIHHQGMPDELIDRYHRERSFIYMGEQRFKPRLTAEIELPEASGHIGELGVIVRAAPPETVHFVEVNGKALVPIRWTSDSPAVRWNSERNPVRNSVIPDPKTMDATTDLMKRMAPNTLRRFRLPKGVLVDGTNRLRLFSRNGQAVPDALLPIFQGVYLYIPNL